MSAQTTNIYKIGDIIRNYRVAGGYSQEELCYGICTSGNLSKIENDLRIPSRNTFEALMHRMGKPADIFPSFMSESEYKQHLLKYEIRRKIVYKRYDEAEELLIELENSRDLDNMDRQFLLYNKAIISRSRDMSSDVILDLFKRSLERTVPKFDIKKILRYALTKDELAIINNIAIEQYRMGGEESSIQIMNGLKQFLEEKVIDSEERASTYTLVLYNLSKWLGNRGQYEDAIKLCDLGIANCVYYGKLPYFPMLIYNKGYCLYFADNKPESEKLVKQSYYILEAMGKPEKDAVADFFKNNFGREIGS